jgi:hypothetical protein
VGKGSFEVISILSTSWAEINATLPRWVITYSFNMAVGWTRFRVAKEFETQ